MRIAYFNHAGEMGGGERSLLDLMASMRATVPPVDLSLVVGFDGPLIREAEALGVETRLVSMPDALAKVGDSELRFQGSASAALSLVRSAAPAALATLRYRKWLERTFREIRPAMVHTNDNKSHLLAAVSDLAGIPLVWHVRDFLGLRRLAARALRLLRARPAGVIAISESVAQDALRVLGKVPVQVIYNGVDTDHFSPGCGDARSLDQLAGLPLASAETVRVGLVATFGRWKGQDLFLEAAGRLLAERPEAAVRFYIVGGPIYRTRGSQFSESELRALAVRCNVASHVGFIGFQPDPAPIYRAVDIAVHASTQPEPFGRTIVEAMACGRPIIAARAGGAAELFTHDHDGIGFDPGQAVSLASAIASLVADPQRRMRLGEQARRTAVARFSRTRLAPDVIGAYDRFVPGLRGAMLALRATVT